MQESGVMKCAGLAPIEHMQLNMMSGVNYRVDHTRIVRIVLRLAFLFVCLLKWNWVTLIYSSSPSEPIL